MPQDEKSSVSISDVLMFVDGETVKVGTPLVDGAKVKATVTAHEKGEKLRVATYKAKSKERKVRGHRQAETVLHIDAISAK
jgi:large subunit ribosomal protein L21